MHAIICRLLLACALLLAAATAPAATDPFDTRRPALADPLAAGADGFLPVEQAYQLQATLQGDTLVLAWDIAPDYYLYRHGFRIGSEGRDLLAEARVPPGVKREDQYFGAVEVYYQTVELVLQTTGLSPKGVLAVSSQGCADAGLCYPPQLQNIRYDLASGSVSVLPAATPTSMAAATPAGVSIGLALAMLLAFGGGLVLNLMPCVLPVLTLKALSFANDHSARHRRQQGWAYTVGVIASFVAIAAVLIALKAAGQAVGWGFQLQSPWFVAALVYLFFTLGLALAGQLNLGASLMGAGANLAAAPGLKGSFFTGVLATAVASPCTAPFMGTALGYAITQPWHLALAIFGALGAGMAAPFLLLSHLPHLQRWLPRPGAWMERLKQLLAFPLFGTAVWLLSVLNSQAGSTGITLVLSGCLLIAFAAWLPGSTVSGKLARGACVAAAIGLLANPTLLGRPDNTNTSIDAWSEARVTELRTRGTPVFVNVTADWCITCLANERVALGSSRVQAAFEANGIHYLKADWTRYDPAISDLLARFGRSGIPLYLFYPADAGAPPQILPQLLTPDIVLQAIGAEPN